MSNIKICFACKDCDYGVNRYWEEYSVEREGEKIKKYRISKESVFMECEDDEAPQVGEIIKFKNCPRCSTYSLVRIPKE